MQDSKKDEFLAYVKREKSISTFHVYEQGLNRFLAFAKMTATEVLTDHKKRTLSEDQHAKDYYKQKISEFYSNLKNEGLTQNSARTISTGIIAFFGYFGFNMPFSRDFWQVQITAKDYVPTIEQYRQLFNIADMRARVLISLSLDLAWRVGDILSVKIAELPDLTQETPIPFERLSEKEDVIAKSFISSETVELLKSYLPTLRPENEFLFQNGNGSAIQDQTVNEILKTLADKAKLSIPTNKRLRFHCFRKRFLSTCADLRIDQNIAKILVGKQVEISMLAYLSEVNLKESWSMVREKLSLFNGKLKTMTDSKDAEISTLRKQVSDLELMIKTMSNLFGSEILEKAQAQVKGYSGKAKLSAYEVLQLLTAKAREEQDEEYKKLLENGDNNHTE